MHLPLARIRSNHFIIYREISRYIKSEIYTIWLFTYTIFFFKFVAFIGTRQRFAKCSVTRLRRALFFLALESTAQLPYPMIFQLQRFYSRSNRKILSLEEFIFRQNVLSTYRSVMRIIYKHHERAGLAQFAREEFRMNSKETELTTRKYLLQTGISKINDMANVFGIKAKL